MLSAHIAYLPAPRLAQHVQQGRCARTGNALALQHQAAVRMPIALGRNAVLKYARLHNAMLLAIAQIVRSVISSNATMEGAAPRPAPANRFHAD